MGDDFTRAQLATYARVVPDMDVIITTAMIPNRSAPELITAEMVVPWYCYPIFSLKFQQKTGPKLMANQYLENRVMCPFFRFTCCEIVGIWDV